MLSFCSSSKRKTMGIYFNSSILLVLVCGSSFIQVLFSLNVSSGTFDGDFHIVWAPTHVNSSADGKALTLKLDIDSGAAILSKDMYLFGQMDMQIKLIPNDSAGTVVAFYLVSSQQNHDELDFEFLGNESGEPYTLQTNVFTDGIGGREERIDLWFDPTVDFHTYSILWNIYQIVFMVDWVPIRLYRNHEDKGVPFANKQPMNVEASIWNADWATRGGQLKVNWTKAPFIASFRNHRFDACVWKGNLGDCSAANSGNWWNQGNFSTLTWMQRRLFKWVRKYYLTYDYCQDSKRFNGSVPLECSLPQY